MLVFFYIWTALRLSNFLGRDLTFIVFVTEKALYKANIYTQYIYLHSPAVVEIYPNLHETAPNIKMPPCVLISNMLVWWAAGGYLNPQN